LHGVQVVGGSNPLAPTKSHQHQFFNGSTYEPLSPQNELSNTRLIVDNPYAL